MLTGSGRVAGLDRIFHRWLGRRPRPATAARAQPLPRDAA
jgi:hypothetical protein